MSIFGPYLIFTGRNEVVAKVMFLHVSVILFTGGVSGEPPPKDQADTPPRENPPDQGRTPQTRQTPPRPGRPPRQGDTPPGPGEPPGPGRHSPPDQADPPRTKENPPRPGRPPWEEDCSIWSMSGQYASYWNAFLFHFFFASLRLAYYFFNILLFQSSN